MAMEGWDCNNEPWGAVGLSSTGCGAGSTSRRKSINLGCSQDFSGAELCSRHPVIIAG